MDKPSDKIYVEHILEAIGFIETFVAGMTVEKFQHDPLRYSAVTR